MSQQKELYISRQGLVDIKKELGQLLEERKIITAKIKEAREFGDLSENAEYQEAKTKQSFTEGRIAEIEAMLKVAKIIDNNNRANGKVALGSKIKLDKIDMEYTITGSNEASPTEGKISNESPLGQALLGKSKGDIVKIETPDGEKQYKIIKVS